MIRSKQQIALFDHILGMRNLRFGQLGHVDQAFNTLVNLGKSAKVHHVGNHAFDQLAQFVLVLDQAQGSGCKRFRLRPIRPFSWSRRNT